MLDIPTDYCSHKQLGIYDDGTQSPQRGLFFPTHSNSFSDLRYYNKKFRCIKDEHMAIHGDYNSAVTSNFVIQFEKCN